MARLSTLLLVLVFTGQADAQRLDVQKLHDRVSLSAPIAGVSVGNPSDKATWRIDFKPEATAGQRSAAQSVITTWADTDWNPPADRRAAKYEARVDRWTHAVVRYQMRLLDTRLSAAKKASIQSKLDAAILKIQDESTSIETEDPD
jgi:hypothetical protein